MVHNSDREFESVVSRLARTVLDKCVAPISGSRTATRFAAATGALLAVLPAIRGKGRLALLLASVISGGRPVQAWSPRFGIWLNLADRIQALMWAGAYEPVTTRVFHHLLRQGDIVIDIGAHIGYFSLEAVNRVGATGKIYAFEPDPSVSRLLSKNVMGRANVDAHELALSDYAGFATFYRSLTFGETGWGTLHPELGGGDARMPVRVRVSTLDGVLEAAGEQGRIALLKIDSEGAENSVLRGAIRTIERDCPLILFEINEICLERAGTSSRLLVAFLESIGYEAWRVEDPRRRASSQMALAWPRGAKDRVVGKMKGSVSFLRIG